MKGWLEGLGVPLGGRGGCAPSGICYSDARLLAWVCFPARRTVTVYFPSVARPHEVSRNVCDDF